MELNVQDLNVIRKKQCILFIIKNDEKFLINNIDEILQLKKENNIVFVVRESIDRSIEILENNNFVFIDLAFDSGYEEALKAGFEFIDKYNYETVIEFDSASGLSIQQLHKINEINKDYKKEKQVIFISKMNKVRKNFKWYIYLSVFKKINDPYSKLRLYNRQALKCIRKCFAYKMYAYNFILLIFLMNQSSIEIKTKHFNKKSTWAQKKQTFNTHFETFIYTIFITPFIKKFKINDWVSIQH